MPSDSLVPDSFDEYKEFIEQFEQCTLPKERWVHGAHLLVALWYVFHENKTAMLPDPDREPGIGSDAGHGAATATSALTPEVSSADELMEASAWCGVQKSNGGEESPARRSLRSAYTHDALIAVRDGIIRYNVSQGVLNTEDAGYHETVTVFWVHMVRAFLSKQPEGRELSCIAAALISEFSFRKNFFREYYSFDLMKSREARRRWVSPDIRRLPELPPPTIPNRSMNHA